MATSWRRAAAVLACAVCASGGAPEGPDRAPRAGPDPRPAAAAQLAAFRLRMPILPLPPAPAAVLRPGSRHAVAAGDTLWAIGASAGVGVDALAAANGVSEGSVLRPGRVLVIPRPGLSAPARVSASRPAVPVRTAGPSRTASPAPAPGPASHLALLWPSGGVVTSRFGWRVHPIFGGREFHTGMDIATRYGSPVVAARTGVVRFVGWKSGYGRIITVEHDGGIETAYSHLSSALVSPGQRVAQGEMIGRIGNSGWSTGPHLFFEVRRNGVPLDPAHYLH